jgi:hypothetical protein
VRRQRLSIFASYWGEDTRIVDGGCPPWLRPNYSFGSIGVRWSLGSRSPKAEIRADLLNDFVGAD